jgi:hypothetical protein
MVNPARRQPADVSSASGSRDVDMKATRKPPAHEASTSPMPAPASVRTSDSVKS